MRGVLRGWVSGFGSVVSGVVRGWVSGCGRVW